MNRQNDSSRVDSESRIRRDASKWWGKRAVSDGGNRAGADSVQGGTGSDILHGDDGKTPCQYHGQDYLDGGDVADTLWGGGEGGELIGGAGNDHLEGDYGTLDVQYHGKDTLAGGQGDDELAGGGKDDVLSGGEGNDALVGDDTPDRPFAAEAHGQDTLFGEQGNDSLSGGGKDDRL